MVGSTDSCSTAPSRMRLITRNSNEQIYMSFSKVFNLKAVYGCTFFIYLFLHSFTLKLWHRSMCTRLEGVTPLFPRRTVQLATLPPGRFGWTVREARVRSREFWDA